MPMAHRLYRLLFEGLKLKIDKLNMVIDDRDKNKHGEIIEFMCPKINLSIQQNELLDFRYKFKTTKRSLEGVKEIFSKFIEVSIPFFSSIKNEDSHVNGFIRFVHLIVNEFYKKDKHNWYTSLPNTFFENDINKDFFNEYLPLLKEFPTDLVIYNQRLLYDLNRVVGQVFIYNVLGGDIFNKFNLLKKLTKKIAQKLKKAKEISKTYHNFNEFGKAFYDNIHFKSFTEFLFYENLNIYINYDLNHVSLFAIESNSNILSYNIYDNVFYPEILSSNHHDKVYSLWYNSVAITTGFLGANISSN